VIRDKLRVWDRSLGLTIRNKRCEAATVRIKHDSKRRSAAVVPRADVRSANVADDQSRLRTSPYVRATKGTSVQTHSHTLHTHTHSGLLDSAFSLVY